MRKRRLELLVWSFLLALAFHPGPFGVLAWLALVRPLVIITRLRGREAYGASYYYGFFFNLFTLYWVARVTPPGILTAIAIVALYYAAVLMIFNKLYHLKPILGLVALPFLWTGLEYFRTLSQFAFPWSDLGYSQAYFSYILQIVSVISVHGLTFLIVVVNVLLWQIFRKGVTPARRVTALWVSVTIVSLLAAHGWIVTPYLPRTGTFDIAILQGSVPIEEKWREGNEQHSFRLYDSLAQSVADSSVRLFIWPETSAPSYLSHSPGDRVTVGRIARSTNAYHIVGALGARRKNERYEHYNSCYLFEPDGSPGPRYDKVKLVPFTEQVPYQDHLPFLKKEFLTEYLTFIETYDVQWWSDFYPGDSVVLFEVDDYLCGVLICYEAAFPEYTREMILEGADFIVGITNDTWFGHSLGIYMHSSYFITRAVENRCWMARSANSGLSYIVDGYGRIRGELPLDAVAVLRGSVRPLDGFSIFTRYGDIAGKASFLITVLLAAIFTFRWFAQKLRLLPRTV